MEADITRFWGDNFRPKSPNFNDPYIYVVLLYYMIMGGTLFKKVAAVACYMEEKLQTM